MSEYLQITLEELEPEHQDTRKIARQLHHDMSLGKELTQPFASSLDGQRLAQFRVLQSALILLGWYPKKAKSWVFQILIWGHQLIMCASMSFGFYSIRGATDATMGSNVLGACIDFVYPLVWLASLGYFRGPHLAESLGRIERNERALVVNFVSSTILIVAFIFCATWGIWQKYSWWLSLPPEKKSRPLDLVLLFVFTATFTLRLFAICTIGVVVQIICYEHRLGVDCFLLGARKRSCFTNESATSTLLRQHMLLCDELRTTGKKLGPVMAMMVLSTAICSVILMVGLYLDIITFPIFMTTASDFFLCFGMSSILLVSAASTSSKHEGVSPEITHYFWSHPEEGVPAHQMIQFTNYFTVNKAHFEMVGISIDGGTVSKLVWGLISFFGLITLRKLS